LRGNDLPNVAVLYIGRVYLSFIFQGKKTVKE